MHVSLHTQWLDSVNFWNVHKIRFLVKQNLNWSRKDISEKEKCCQLCWFLSKKTCINVTVLLSHNTSNALNPDAFLCVKTPSRLLKQLKCVNMSLFAVTGICLRCLLQNNTGVQSALYRACLFSFLFLVLIFTIVFRSSTDLISLLILLLFLLEWPLPISLFDWDEILQVCLGLYGIDWRSQIFDLTSHFPVIAAILNFMTSFYAKLSFISEKNHCSLKTRDTVIAYSVITARCTIVQSAVLRLHVVRLSVCDCDVGGSGSHRLEIWQTNCTDNWRNTLALCSPN